MTAIDQVGAAPSPVAAVRAGARAAASGFRPPDADGGSAPAADADPAPAAALAAPVALDSLLALQQVDEAAERNQAARRRGQALLATLSRLQRALLETGDPAFVVAELRSLAADVPPASDPALAVALQHVVLRARIELARRGG